MARRTLRRGPVSKLRGLILIVGGVTAIVWGVSQIGTTTASCDGQTMHVGDTCVITTNGVRSGTMSVSQQLAAEHNDGLGSIAGGVLLLAVGGIVVGKRGQEGTATPPPGPAGLLPVRYVS